MAHEQALMMVNDLKNQLAGVARAIVAALGDGKMQPWEGVMLGQRGLQLALTLTTVLQGADGALRHDILHVLEQGQVVLPEGSA